MLNVPGGYRIIERLYDGPRTVVYRCLRLTDQLPVIIKAIKHPFPTVSDLARLRHQFEILNSLELPGIIKAYGLEQNQRGLALILEDYGGLSLDQYIHASQSDNHAGHALSDSASKRIPLKIFFDIALQLSDLLEQLHSHQLIHKDIKPGNILIHPETLDVKLIDFSIAVRTDQASKSPVVPETVDGTLAYMSPEQTGRTNRSLDYRTDYYSLGITFYRLLTGQLPYRSSDSLQLIHEHIAGIPVPLQEINAEIPISLSDSILKLMAKAPEDRYQTAYGLEQDLLLCKALWEKSDRLTSIELGSQDRLGRFSIPQKLYGCEAEKQFVYAAYRRVVHGSSEAILISGGLGTGKTSLLQDIYSDLSREQGYCIKGKFNKVQTGSPFSALTEALQDLVQKILTEDWYSIQNWKTTILEAIGNNGQVLVDLIPELELLIGKQPETPLLDSFAAQNRFNLTFENLLSAISKNSGPLILFLDDLQWADSASRQLISSSIFGKNIGCFLVVATSRTDEGSKIAEDSWNAENLLANLNLEESGTAVIALNPFTLESLTQLIIESLDRLDSSSDSVQKLAAVIHAAAGGNPLLGVQILKNLYKEGLIRFDKASNKWQWNLPLIQSSLLSDLSTYSFPQLQDLSSLCQTVLSVAACCVRSFSKTLISSVLDISEDDIQSALQEAVEAEFILLNPLQPQAEEAAGSFGADPLLNSDNQENCVKLLPALERQPNQPQYSFTHERIQHTAYLAVPESEKISYHYKIGTSFLQDSITVNDESSYEAVLNLNLCADHINDTAQRLRLAHLNLKIGSRYRDSTAFAEALEFFAKGIEFTGGLSWQTESNLLFQLHLGAAECSLMLGRSAQMNGFLLSIEANALNDLDRIKALQLKIEFFKSRAQIKDAIETGLLVLSLLNVSLPQSPSPQDFEAELESVITPEQIGGLVALPVMTDRVQLVVMQVLSSLLPITYSYSPLLFSIILIRLVSISVRYGNSPVSSWSYIAYGVLLWNLGKGIETVCAYGEVGWELGRNFGSKPNLVISNFTYSIFIRSWQGHLRETLPDLLSNYALSLEVGDYMHASFSLTDYLGHAFWCGTSLTELNDVATSYHTQFCSLRQELTLRFYEVVWQGITDLTSNSSDDSAFDVQIYEAPQMLQRLSETNNRQGFFLFYLHKLHLSFLQGAYRDALTSVQAAETYLDAVPCRAIVVVFYFYRLLILLACCSEAEAAEKAVLLQQVDEQAAQLQRWAEHAPMNVLHKCRLVQAERYRIQGYRLEAMDAYDQAIALAQEHGYLNEEALAHELAGLFYLSCDKTVIAQTYLINAYYAYERWGATAKLNDLQARHSALLSYLENKDPRLATLTMPSTVSLGSKADILDWASILRASQTLSQEMDQNKLLQSILKVIIENAGAERGSLLLTETDRPTMKAHCVIADSGKGCALSSDFADLDHALPHSIINYVERTKISLVIADAASDQRFATDNYILQYQPRSVLCMPIQRKSSSVGILYLENNLISGAFTHDRLEVMQILLTQAAISLENAQLYSSVEQKVLDRTLELETAKLEAEVAKEKAEQANVAKSEFLASMSHELRTPLNAVLGFSQILYRDPLTSVEQQKKLSIIKRSGEHLLTLINDVLTMSKIESGRTRLYKTTFDLSSMLVSLYEMLSLKATEKDLRLKFSLMDDIPLLIHTDEVKLRQILINLLGNALKFTQQGSVELLVSLDPFLTSAGGTMARLEFKIEDTGPGIELQELSELFKPFCQTSSGRVSQEGTGLGLPISRTFVQLMGGDIQVSSIAGQGSCFCFSVLVDLPKAALQSVSASGTVIGLAPGQPHYRILAVEDQLENQQVLLGLLQPIGLSLEIVSSGPDAIAYCKAQPPDLILMDLQMPEMSGFQAAQAILENAKQFSQPPILIALTANAFDEVRLKALEDGFSDFLSKPFEPEKLFEVISRHLNLQYRYLAPTARLETSLESESDTRSITLMPGLLQQLSSDWRAQALLTAQRLDEQTLLELVSQIEMQFPFVAEKLTNLIEDFDFEMIVHLLKMDEPS